MTRRTRLALMTGALGMVGCQQKMADQPAPRPYEENALFKHNQSARPLEKGTVHVSQRLADDPLASWLTPEGRKASDTKPSADASFDPKSVVPTAGAPTKPEHFVAELPFEVTAADLKRGQSLYNAACGVCHGAAGYGDGKIPERGFLRPPSYHTDPAGKEMDWSTLGETSTGLPMGYSRGFYRWGVKVALKDVPIGYITQVITWGYGGMASHDTQLPDWADRWKVAAYVRTLQLSQSAPVDRLPQGVKEKFGKPVPVGNDAADGSHRGTGHEGGHK